MSQKTKLVIQTLSALALTMSVSAAPPEDFPTFHVPGHEKEMATLRELFWLHYPGAGPKAPLWEIGRANV